MREYREFLSDYRENFVKVKKDYKEVHSEKGYLDFEQNIKKCQIIEA